MKHIGLKIKELRKKKDMTQEKLAEYLNVSFQAVSKWETGIASPDLSMIVPLSRLFDVSTDELFGLSEEQTDARQDELRTMWEETWESGDTAKRYEIAQTAVKEYPGNFEFLKWLADAEDFYAVHNCERYSKEQKEHFENCIKHLETIINNCPDKDITESAISGMVYVLPNVGRREEAVLYARQHPNCDELLMWCLSGEELRVHRQKMIEWRLKELINILEFGRNDLNGIRAAESIVKTIIDDENYLYYNSFLMYNYICQAICYTHQKQYSKAIEILKKSYSYAEAYENVKKQALNAPVSYTCPILNKLVFDASELSISGTSTLIEDFYEYLQWEEFEPLRNIFDLKEIFG
ncbi:MAG: helix-turn-helix transcriptional regulator [Clostridia bacterium]|nr:helix-turn-helix transcriptional regulator [Clostridia bacterium]